MASQDPRCKEMRTKIQARVDGELSPAESRQLDIHIESCPACAAWLRQVQAENLALTQFLGAASETELDLDHAMAAVRQRISVRAASARAGWLGVLARLFLAGVGVAVGTVVLSFGRLDSGAIVRGFLRDLRLHTSIPDLAAPIALAVLLTSACLVAVSYALIVFSRKETSNAV